MGMWPDSDRTQELLRSAGEGQQTAVNELLERHRDAVRQMVHVRLDRAVMARVDASDVVQDVLLEASQRLSDYVRSPAMPFHLWLRQLAKDRLIDMHRRHRAAQRRSVDRERSIDAPLADQSSLNLAAQLIAQDLTPAAATLRREIQQRFLTALQDLSEDDREIILMRHHEHLTNSEVAESLGLTQAAAGMRYLRALRRLRDVLGDDQSQSGSTPAS
jgi:RNA polymerase sigma-70 factor (ECF subfamily)